MRTNPDLPFARNRLCLKALVMTVTSLALPCSPEAATFTVTNANNDGAGSLRAALVAANGTAETDDVIFASTMTITPTTALPMIIHPLNLLGDAHLGTNPTGPGVTLIGTAMPTDRENGGFGRIKASFGLVLGQGAGGSQIRGLRFWHWNRTEARFALNVTADDVSVRNCHFEYDPVLGPSVRTANHYGPTIAFLNGMRCRFGGSTTGQGNIVNGYVEVSGGGSVFNGNRFGFWTDGSTHATGMPSGVKLTNLSSIPEKATTIIGGPSAGERNYFDSTTAAVDGTGNFLIQGNWFGISPAGEQESGGGRIRLSARSEGVIGGDTPAHGNVFNGETIELNVLGMGSRYQIGHNLLGFAPNGAPTGGWAGGIKITGGGQVRCHDNALSNVLEPGIKVVGDFPKTPSVELSRNTITRGLASVTPILLAETLTSTSNAANDPLDFDLGVNGLQNFPMLTSVSRSPTGTLLVNGLLESNPSESFRIEFFTGGQTFAGPSAFIASVMVTTNSAGYAAIAHDLGPVPGNLTICATATRINGLRGPNTSPLSNVLPVASPGRFQFQAGGPANGAEGTTLSVTIQRVSGSEGSASVRLVATPSGGDVSFSGTAPDGSVAFAHGETSKTITLHLTQDVVDELDTELVTLTLENPSPGTSVNSTPRLIGINDDDAAPTLAISNAVAHEGNAGQTLMAFTATLSAPSERVLAILPMTPEGSGTFPADTGDWGAATVTTVNPTTFIIGLPVLGDVHYEPTETFQLGAALRLRTSAFGAYSETAASPGTGTIINDDAAPAQSVAFTTSFADPSEDEGSFTATITRDDTSSAVTVDVSAEDLGAVRGVDYMVAKTTTLSFPAGVASRKLTVTLMEDAVREDLSQFQLRLENPTPGVGLTSPAVLTVVIKDNDPVPVLVLDDVSLMEGNDPASPAVAACTVLLSGNTELTVSAMFATRDGSASDDSDFVPTSGSLDFAPGETAKTVFVPLRSDTDFENDEVFYLDFSFVREALTPDPEMKITVANDDASVPVLTLAGAPASMLENADPVPLRVVRTGRLDQSAQFALEKLAGDAKAGDDFVPLTPEFVLPAGEREMVIHFSPVDDSEAEPTKSLTLGIIPQDGVSQTGMPSTAKFDIVSDDVPVVRNIVLTTADETSLETGAETGFGETVVGESSEVTLAVENLGNASDSLLVSIAGADAGNFSIVAPVPPTLIPAASGRIPLIVRFTPTGTGPRTAILHLESAYSPVRDIVLNGIGVVLSNIDDADGDGLSDLAEHQLRALGFDRAVGQPDLVTALFGGSNSAGLFTRNQLQVLRPDAPLIARDPLSGQFRLTIGLQKSTDLLEFLPMPFQESGVSVTPQGKIEYHFTSPDPAAFFRISND